MNKKFLALLVLLSVIPGCGWGPRYQCNQPCGQPRTTCVEATDSCYQEAQGTTCYEDNSGTSAVGEEICYEATGSEANDNVEYCYEATDYTDAPVAQYPTESYSYENASEETNQDFEEFDFDEFDDYKN